MVTKNDFIAVGIGVLIGLALMFVFQYMTLLIEINLLDSTNFTEIEEYKAALNSNAYLAVFYVLSWSSTVLGAGFCAALISKNHKLGTSLFSGGIFYLLLLYNPETIQANLMVYVSFVIFGAISLLIPGVLLKKAG